MASSGEEETAITNRGRRKRHCRLWLIPLEWIRSDCMETSALFFVRVELNQISGESHFVDEPDATVPGSQSPQIEADATWRYFVSKDMFQAV
jgi:hypothetical protein